VRFLTAAGYPERLCALVVHHSAATCEAEERGLRAELTAWPRKESAVADALWMTVADYLIAHVRLADVGSHCTPSYVRVVFPDLPASYRGAYRYDDQ
jgi:hypothetical protein